MDLSSPGGASVNDGINPDEFSLHYITVDQGIRTVSQFVKGALIAKFGRLLSLGYNMARHVLR